MSVLRTSTKARYLFSSAWKAVRRHGRSCPSCGCRKSRSVDRKFGVTSLRRCEQCRLLFRSPTTTEAENARFYQNAYRQGGTTDMPSDEQLQQLLAKGFRETSEDASSYLGVLKALGIRSGARVLDFGCSWGYGSWQLKRAGYDVQGFEISQSRCDYARRKLGIDAVDRLEQISGTFDCVFSAHVIEHVPSVREFIEFAQKRLRPGGLFVAFTPNGSNESRSVRPLVWHQLWGLVHPQLCDVEYCRSNFEHVPTLVASDPYVPDEIAGWDQTSRRELRLDGCELLFVFRQGE
jgi:2-polyprenyl-3-methyl-5-hydroxy-6-metoxy-1,4-benzoquinol methylase